MARVLLRRDILTAWQVERLKKGDLTGFDYGGCKVLFHIAEGTFARVYRGRRMEGNQSVAIKVLRQRFVADSGAVARFNQEAESGLRLVHPNIVRIYEYGERDKKYLHDHGIRRGVEPPRLPPDPGQALADRGAPADASAWPTA